MLKKLEFGLLWRFENVAFVDRFGVSRFLSPTVVQELDKPMNIHRWRSLADRDPERWALLQRVHSLQAC